MINLKNIFKSVVYTEYKDKVMTVRYSDGSEVKYSGECTVWHKLPHMKRCGVLTETWLCNLWKYCTKND